MYGECLNQSFIWQRHKRLGAAVSQLCPITPWIINSNDNFFFFISDTHHNEHHCTNLLIRMCYWAWHWPFKTLRTSEDVFEKHPEHSRQPFRERGWFDISLTGVFIEQHRASLSFLHHEPIPAQTLLAVLLTHWKSHHVSTLAEDSMSS